MKLWLYYLCVFFGIILARYFLVAGGAYWLFYTSKHNLIEQNQIKFPSSKAVKRDIALSAIATLPLAICSALVTVIYNSGATRIYSSLGDRSSGYLIASFFGVIILQDALYYFFHRGFHHPLIYNWLHRGHHLSKHPTPWTSFALDFPEALIQGLFMVGVVFVIPLHLYVLTLLLVTMTVWALVNHLGFELFPNFPQHWLGQWFISSDNHSIHHREHTRNYGLYFTIWDRLLKTN